MNKQSRKLVLLILAVTFCLSGCLSHVWTGASLLYDRHSVYKKIDDYALATRVNYLIFHDEFFKRKGCVIDLAVFNGDVLVAGHVPTERMQEELKHRLARLSDYRHIYNEVVVAQLPSQTLTDTWITTKIRAHLLSDSSIDPNAFKVITTDRVVYLMGEAKSDEARKVVHIARETHGVKKVVKLMRYYVIMAKEQLLE